MTDSANSANLATSKRYAIYNVEERYIKEIGGKNIVSARTMQMIFADLSDGQVSQLQSDEVAFSEVKSVNTDITPIVPLPGTPSYTPSDLFDYIGLVSLREITNPPLYGKNLNIAVIDTGIRETHQKVEGHIVARRNFTTAIMEDGFNHGTAIAGIIAELAPQAGILNLKVLDGSGSGTEETVALAFDYCIELVNTGSPYAPSVINLSSGAPDLNNPNAAIRVACRQALAAGIIVIAAAGNSGPANSTIVSPACERYVIAVGSCAADTRIVSNFSSRGPTLEGLTKPDCVLFGENLVVASASGDSDVTAKSGTSFSAPIAAVMALLAQEGIIRLVQYNGGVPLGFAPQALPGTLNNGSLIDTWIPKITTKPEGVASTKDNDYGYGVPFGELITAVIRTGSSGTLDISSLVIAMMSISMITMMMKIVSPNTQQSSGSARSREPGAKVNVRLPAKVSKQIVNGEDDY